MKRVIAAAVLFSLALAAQGAGERGKKKRAAAPRRRAGAEIVVDAAAVNDPKTQGVLGPGSSGSAVVRAEILLDRAHFSPGEIDAKYGSNLRKAIAAYQKAHGLPETGVVDAATWAALNEDAAPALVPMTISEQTAAGPYTPDIPADMEEKAKLPALNYSSAEEAIGEEFHVSPKLLEKLNPGVSFDNAGAQIVVPNVKVPSPGPAASVVVSKSDKSVTALDADGRVLAYYPATIGSVHDPLPIGDWKIAGVSRNPAFHYNPKLFWDAKPTDEKARIPPGPNNPVGVVWIDLSKEHYGIHGTPEPSQIGRTESHGCIRLTNWDAWELAGMVAPGTRAKLQE